MDVTGSRKERVNDPDRAIVTAVLVVLGEDLGQAVDLSVGPQVRVEPGHSVRGDAPERALALAESILAEEEIAGSVLFLTDGIDRMAAETFRDFATQTGNQLIFLAFGGDEGGPIDSAGWDGPARDTLAPPVDRAGLAAVASASLGSILEVSLDDTDVTSITRRIRTHLVDTLDRDDALAWRDNGYPLVWAVAFCMLFWFRRGWTVQWRL